MPTEDEKTAESIRDNSGKYSKLSDYLKSVLNDIQIIPIIAPKASDFSAIPTLPERPNRGPVTHILVLETGDVGISHIEETSYTANGVLQKLFNNMDSKKDQPAEVIAIWDRLELDGELEKHVRFARPRGEEQHAIISLSVAEPENSPYSNYKPDEKGAHSRTGDARIIPTWKAGGNDGSDGRDFQDSLGLFNTFDVTRVGYTRAHKGNPSLRQVARASENGVMILGPMLTKDDVLLNGSSFSTPILATFNAACARRYGQWEKNPYGLTYAEIKHVICATANTAIVDPTWGEVASFKKLPNGFPFHKKAGFGEIDILAADELAHKLFAYKEAHQIKNTLTSQHTDISSVNGEHEMKFGQFHREIKIDEAMIADTMLLNLDFKKIYDLDGSTIRNLHSFIDGDIEYEGARIPINFAMNGKSVVAGLTGMHLPKGATLVLQTYAPVEQGSVHISGTRADVDYLRMLSTVLGPQAIAATPDLMPPHFARMPINTPIETNLGEPIKSSAPTGATALSDILQMPLQIDTYDAVLLPKVPFNPNPERAIRGGSKRR